jgi:hypothetical protein
MEGSPLARSGDVMRKMKMGIVECCAVMENVGMNVRYRTYCTTENYRHDKEWHRESVIHYNFLYLFFGGLECVGNGHFFAYFAHL